MSTIDEKTQPPRAVIVSLLRERAALRPLRGEELAMAMILNLPPVHMTALHYADAA